MMIIFIFWKPTKTIYNIRFLQVLKETKLLQENFIKSIKFDFLMAERVTYNFQIS